MKILNIIYYIFIAFVGAVAILLVLSIFPITGNYKLMVVQSGSMEPVIKTGSLVIVKPAKEYKINDVVTFMQADTARKSVTHRIVGTEIQNGEQVFVTKGDTNDSSDSGRIRQSQIIGRLLFSVPYAGYVVDFAKKPYGFLTLVIIPAVVIVFDQLKNVFVELRKMRAAKKATG